MSETARKVHTSFVKSKGQGSDVEFSPCFIHRNSTPAQMFKLIEYCIYTKNKSIRR